MMKTAVAVVLAAVLTGGLPGPSPAQSTGGGDPGAVYSRMQRVNAGLRSFSATFHVDVQTHGFPYISPSLDGHAYYEAPDKNAVVFDTVPALASQFKKVYPQIEPPSQWPSVYDVTPVSDNGTTTQLRLVKRTSGRIDHIDVTADDKTATVSSMTYVYKDNGGTISFSQTYDQIGGNFVIRSQTGKVALPNYNADVASSFSNYKINVPIDRTVFDG